MNIEAKFAGLEVGYDVPAIPGMSEDEIQTPCLILDLDALERNIRKMGDYAKAHNMRHRAHGKMHKSVDVLRLQQELGGAIGVCCQKVSEAEVFRAPVSRMYSCRTRCAIQPRSTGWRCCRATAHA
jgi:3-hydroxy-D-aspartate aldolase